MAFEAPHHNIMVGDAIKPHKKLQTHYIVSLSIFMAFAIFIMAFKVFPHHDVMVADAIKPHRKIKNSS